MPTDNALLVVIGAEIVCDPLTTSMAAAATPLLTFSGPAPPILNEVADRSLLKIIPPTVLPPPSTNTDVALAPVRLPPLNRTAVPIAFGDDPPAQFVPSVHEPFVLPSQSTIGVF